MWALIDRSRNAKIGPISATMTQSKSCPSCCPLKSNGCYAESSFVGMHWRKLDREGGATLKELCQWIRRTATHVWRYGVAGDLPGNGNGIDCRALDEIVRANKGKRGFTYTHKPMTPKNAHAVAHCNGHGFTVNLSANNLRHADELADLGVGPVVTVLPSDQLTNTKTPSGRRVVVCPAVTHDNVTCASCKLCAMPKRSCIVGFPAHGTKKAKVNEVAR